MTVHKMVNENVRKIKVNCKKIQKQRRKIIIGYDNGH